ncbi:hypothetical protein LTR85_004162 [Meristemomyces frigidus]|nr:hypothetical protein LTR85_004162 [Meristemomyces frigidus]
MAQTVSFPDARKIIAAIGKQKAARLATDELRLPIDQAVGHVTKAEHKSPTQTPVFDSATTNGYAVISRQAIGASPTTPLLLRVHGFTAAGDMPLEVDDQVTDGYIPCVEIEVGSPFPATRSTGVQFDGLIPVEHTRVVHEGGEGKIVESRSPPLTTYHKRIAGSDFHRDDKIVGKGEYVMPRHVMALASVGITDISCVREVRVGVISVGSELVTTMLPHRHGQRRLSTAHSHKIPDANGYYLTSSLREMGVQGVYLGAVPSDSEILTNFLREHLEHNSYDVIIASEGAMTNRVEQIPRCLYDLNGVVHFTHVLMNPGGTTMFASLPPMELADASRSADSSFYGSGSAPTDETFISLPKTPANNQPPRSEVAFFGLPGAPIASAAAMRFLVTPYIRQLRGMADESAMLGKVIVAPSMPSLSMPSNARPVNATAIGIGGSNSITPELIAKGNAQMDLFRHGSVLSEKPEVAVEISREQNTAKTSPFASSNCWVHIPRGHEGVDAGSVTWIYPFCSPKS